jgi:hypothetical protein
MSEVIPTTERLAQALEMLNVLCLKGMIVKARAGHYDDYKSELATPLVQLVRDLRAADQEDMAQRVIDGEFDGTRQEAAEWFKREGYKFLEGLDE